MMRLYIAGGFVALVVGMTVTLWVQSDRLKARDAEIAVLTEALKTAERTAIIERRTQTIIREIHTQSAEVQTDVQMAADPECANPEPVLDAWRSGIERLRHTAGSDEHTADGDAALYRASGASGGKRDRSGAFQPETGRGPAGL